MPAVILTFYSVTLHDMAEINLELLYGMEDLLNCNSVIEHYQ